MKKKKIDYGKSINIKKDIWFYPYPKSFEFVVWQEINGAREAVIFRLRHSEIKKYLP